MEKRIFGETDGIREEVGKNPLRPNAMRNLGRAIARHFNGGLTLLGRDTRKSGEWMREEMETGLVEYGGVVDDLEILPTPAVQKIVKIREDVKCGIMLTASHNPASDNGVKVFAGDGDKLPDEEEVEVEDEYFKMELEDDIDLPEVKLDLVTREDVIDVYAKMVDEKLELVEFETELLLDDHIVTVNSGDRVLGVFATEDDFRHIIEEIDFENIIDEL